MSDLPDSYFLLADKRLFAYKDEVGQVSIDRLQEAIAEIPLAEMNNYDKAQLMAKAKQILDIEKRATEAAPTDGERLSEPYARNRELPPSVKNSLPEEAQTIYRKAHNAAMIQYDGDEIKAAKVAWAAVKKVFKKVGKEWVKKVAAESLQPVFDRFAAVTYEIGSVLECREALERVMAESEPPAPAEPDQVGASDGDLAEEGEVPAESLAESDTGDPMLIQGCTFIRAGLNKPGSRFWNEQLLAESVALFDGSLCYIDHPVEGQPRSLRSLAAHTLNVRWDPLRRAVVGDIRLLDNDAGQYVRSVFSNPVVRKSTAAGLSVIFDNGQFEATRERQGSKVVQVPRRLGPGKAEVDFVSNPTAYGQVGEFVTL